MTSIAAQLLGLALQLLIAAQQPNVPTELKIQAVQTATYAIEYAQASMPDEALNPISQPEPLSEATPIETQEKIETPVVGGYTDLSSGYAYDTKPAFQY